MKDIPIFTTTAGTASLLLREIPYKKTACVFIRTVLPGGLETVLSDCRDFCLQAGAERVLVTADQPLDLPLDHDLLELSRPKSGLPFLDKPVPLEPLTWENASAYQTVYNRLFAAISTAATCDNSELSRLIPSGTAFLTRVDGSPAGIGAVQGCELRAVGVLPEYRGLGRRLTLTLLEKLDGPELFLSVASTNKPALRLYERLGFQMRRVLGSWYCLTG